MINRQVELGNILRTTFVSGAMDNRDVLIVLGGAQAQVTSSVVNIALGVYSLSFTPAETGQFDVLVDNVLIASYEVVTRSVFSFLQNLEDQALGSWEWNKSTKEMSLFRLDGTLLASYTADDTPEEAFSRFISP